MCPKKNSTGRRRYTLAECDQALALKKGEPARYRRLPKGLRDAAEKLAEFNHDLPRYTANLVQRISPKLMKIQELKERFPWFKDLRGPYPAFLELLRRVRIPKKPGQKVSRQTTARILKWAILKLGGMGIRRISRTLWPRVTLANCERKCLFAH